MSKPTPIVLRRLTRAALIGSLAVACTPVYAQEIFGVVSAVHSGDRLVLSAVDRTIDVQLAQIAAPAHGVPLAAQSRESLADICYGKAATLMVTGTALNGDTIGKVSCGGVPANEEQVRRGMARVEQPYRELNSLLRDAEREAVDAAVGMWREPVRGR